MRNFQFGLWLCAAIFLLTACQTAEELAREEAAISARLPAACQGQPTATIDTGKIGVVFLHGKGGRPRGNIQDLGDYLSAKGFKVELPEMTWSRVRRFDRSLAVAIDEIGQAVQILRRNGATAIIVGGQSLGGTGALAYGAGHDGLAGVIVVAGGGDPYQIYNFSKDVRASVAEAKSMVAAGKGDQQNKFADLNVGRTGTLRTTAQIYLSFFDPEGPALMPRNAAALKDAPLLWVYGRDDPLKDTNYRGYAFDKAPEHALNAYVTIDAGHLDAPLKGRKVIEAWLRCVGSSAAS